jgi:O-acetyl-ADP-ribose deacetylase (regulator of RNase III)
MLLLYLLRKIKQEWAMNLVQRGIRHAEGCEVKLVQGDITREDVDAIVNAANSRLAHGGGVAGAIVRAGGESIQHESSELAPVEVGHAVMTGGGNLPAKHVIHAVGPRWGEGEEHEKLAAALRNSLLLAGEAKLASVSLPAISTGIFGFPLQPAVTIILGEIRAVLDEKAAPSLKEIRLCLFDDATMQGFLAQWDGVWGVHSP